MRLWWHRDTLVEILARDVARTPDDGPDWTEVVEDAVYRQDMEWISDAIHIGDLAGTPTVACD